MKILLLLASSVSLLLPACASDPVERRINPDEFFATAKRCMNDSARKEKIQIPIGGSFAPIEILLTHDPSSFAKCMQKAGFVPPKADVLSYLNTVRKCLDATKSTVDPASAYAECAKQGGIRLDIELIKED